MSKFLDLIEENTPDLNLDEKIAAKRALQRCLMEKDIKCDVDQRSEDVMIHLPDGRIVKLEVKEFVNVEDQEMMAATDTKKMTDMANTAAKIMAIKSPSLKDQVVNPASRKIQMAKRTLADKVYKAAKKFEI